MKKETLDEVIQRSTVEFPRALSLTGVKHLFTRMEDYLRAEIRCEVSYTTNGRFNDNHNLSINGKITLKLDDRPVTDSFESYQYKIGDNKIKGFNFCRIPGYELNEYRREVVALWDKVREFVAENLSH